MSAVQLVPTRGAYRQVEGGLGSGNVNIGTPAAVNNIPSSLGTISMAAVWRLHTAPAGGNRVCVGKYDGTNGFSLNHGTDTTIAQLQVRRAANWGGSYLTTGSLTVGQWSLCVFTWDSVTLANCKAYRARLGAGQPVLEDRTDPVTTVLGTGASGTDDTISMRMFTGATGGNAMPLEMAAVGLWNRVLSFSEAQSLLRRSWKTTGPRGLWYPGHDRGDATTTSAVVYDSSGRGSHGTVVNTSLSRVAGAPVGLIQNCTVRALVGV